METQAAYPSPPDPTEAAAAARRAQVLVHTRYPSAGRWYPPAAGLWAAAFIAAYALPSIAFVAAAVALVGLAGAWAGYYVNKRGVHPSMSTAPTAIKRAFLGLLAIYAVGVALTYVVFQHVGWWAGALVGGIGFGLIVWDYERRYAIAARRAEAEAGVEPAAEPGAGE